MKLIGIWLDYEQANVISINDDNVDTQTIKSNIEHFHPKGGSRSKTPWGPMENISESKYLYRKNQQSAEFFEEICKTITGDDELYIFGPAEAKLGLSKYLDGSTKIRPFVRSVETADSMTINQKVAKVKSFFGKKL